MNNTYIGTRVVNAEPMTRLEYNKLRGFVLPKYEDGKDKGYKITDIASSHNSWLPESEFDRLYKSKTKYMTFGLAIEALKMGHKVARHGWNGKGMHIVLAEEGCFYKVKQLTNAETGTEPFIVMFTADKKFQPGWLASQSDILSEDWVIIN